MMDLYIKLSVCVPRLIPGRGFYAQISLEITSEFPGVTSQKFDSLSHLAQKLTLHEQRFAEAKKNFKKINHVYPYMYDSDDEDDSEVAAVEWVRSKKLIPCQWVKSFEKEEV